MRKCLAAFVLMIPAVVLVGCGSNGGTPESSAPTPGNAVAPVPVDITEVKYEQLDAAVEAHKGKVVLIDFWATWCGPCVAKFPHFVEIHKKYRDKGLVNMSVSMDPRGKENKYDKAEVLKFLKEKDATFPNFVLLDYAEDNEKIEKRFGLEGGIPFMVLFDKTGKRVWTSEEWAEKEWTKEQYNAELNKLIEAQLAK